MGGRAVGFALVTEAAAVTTLRCAPAMECVLSWNSFAESGEIEFSLRSGAAHVSPWLPFARWSPQSRRSFPCNLLGVSVLTDIVRSEVPFDAVHVRTNPEGLQSLALATPTQPPPSFPYAGGARIHDVPLQSQYVVEGEAGWCSPASLTMLLRFHGIDARIEEVAAGVFDEVYGGYGNWAFNVAYAGTQSLRAALAYVGSLDIAEQFLERNLPLALSYAWEQGELPGAPIPRSAGHLAVLCGFTSNGDCVMNDPAAPRIRTIYPRRALERCWQRHGGVAYVLAPVGIPFADLLA